MYITIRPIGLLKSYCQELLDDHGRVKMVDCEGQTIAKVCREIGLPLNLVSLFIVNGMSQPSAYRLQPGDDVKCIALIGGG